MDRRPKADFYVTQSLDPPKRDFERLILRTSEESFRLIVETIPGLIAVMTPEGQASTSTVRCSSISAEPLRI